MLCKHHFAKHLEMGGATFLYIGLPGDATCNKIC
jgi:hypothetical protein